MEGTTAGGMVDMMLVRCQTMLKSLLHGIDGKRLFFLNGQIAKGNLKPRRQRTKTETMRRVFDRLLISEMTKDSNPSK